MPSHRLASSPRRPGLALAAACAGLLAVPLAATGAAAQAASGCGDLKTLLEKRQAIAGRLSANGKKQIDAKVACAGFGQLVANGTTLIKWAEANKDWCQVPDSFIASVKGDHAKATEIRGKACGIAAKQVQAEKQAREGGGGGGLLGGGGLTGPTRMPQGAL